MKPVMSSTLHQNIRPISRPQVRPNPPRKNVFSWRIGSDLWSTDRPNILVESRRHDGLHNSENDNKKENKGCV